METYVNNSSRLNGPVKVSQKPIIPVNRWILENKRLLRKNFAFDTMSQRNWFVSELMEFEGKNGHAAQIMVSELSVELQLSTKGVDVVTELDKEYAKFADVLYADVMYVPEHEHKLAY